MNTYYRLAYASFGLALVGLAVAAAAIIYGGVT